MKKIIILLISTLVALNANSLDWVTQTVNDMKTRRTGMDKNLKINDPFMYSKRDKPVIKVKKIIKKTKIVKIEKKRPLILQAVLNERAKISGIWYKKGSQIRGMKLAYLSQESITLNSGSRNKHLFLKQKNKKITLSKNWG